MSFSGEKQTESVNGKERKILRRILLSGIASIVLLLIIIYTLPKTVLTTSSLIEYATIVALVIFLFILLIRYFGILIFSYFYMNEYTFKPTNGFKPFVSIIIPVFNEAKIIDRSINSLLKLDYPNYEIIIVNDGSTDNTKKVAETFVGYRNGIHNKVKVSLINKPNGGKSSALNLGINISDAEFVLCMDGDSMLTPQSLKMAVRHFVNPEIGAVAGNVKVLNRGKFFTDLQALEYLEGLNMARSAQSSIKLVNIIPGPIGLFRKKAIESAGLYSSDTFAEDADLTLRILSKGWKINYEPNSISFTEAPIKLQQLLKQRYRWTRGILQSIRKHKKLIINPTIKFSDTFILWSMFYEALIWPPMNLAAHLFFIVAALFFGFTTLIFYWWAGLALLDIVAALYCVAAEKEEFRLIGYAIFYRMIFILIIDICKTMSTVEEFLGIKMIWGKLERSG
ncbi:MAG: glycosyltransferase family 2 protein [Ignavibacteriaceae bacterium]|nr:glycosyltransferase family 2 protein [Ignavibacteria bacterium]NNJ52952.1 glycosyltransferase family 2 protein [Ignavibacteriaceae bacterium]